MNNIIRYALQGIAYTVFCLIIYFLSTAPAYNYLEADQAEIKLAFKHASQRLHDCTKLTRADLKKLPPNMRKPKSCPRERAIVQVIIYLDGKMISDEKFIPPGLHQDATVFAYSKLPLPAGDHLLSVNMRDSARKEGFDYSKKEQLSINPGQALIIGFDSVSKELIFTY
ncbi:MAG: hypothetical protein HQL68_07315 [Magnetococcales bacterium]|nr:hypothetical protein [Magnetococcales bacterium]